MQATLGFKLSYLLTILTAAAVWPGSTRCSNYFFTEILKESSSSCLAFIMLNLVAAAIFLSNSSSSNIGKPHAFAEQFLPPLIRCQVVVEGVSEGAAAVDDGHQDKGDFHACTPSALPEAHKQVDVMMHKDSDGDSVRNDENGNCDGDDDDENDKDDDNDDDDDDNDDDDIDPIDLQKRSQEFIDKITQGWMIEKLRDGLMHPP